MDVAAISALLAAGATVAGGGFAFGRLQARLEQSRRETEQARLAATLEERASAAEKALAEMRETVAGLRRRMESIHRSGAAASAQKQLIDDALSALIHDMNASAGSVLVPYSRTAGEQPAGLIFATMLPLDGSSLKLRNLLVPLEGSNAGKSFVEDREQVIRSPATHPDHFREADKASGRAPDDILSMHLHSGGQVVGVLQLLDRKDCPFVDADLRVVASPVAHIGRLVGDFLKLPGYLDVIGFQDRLSRDAASIVFCDITRSSELFRCMDARSAIDFINDVLTAVCDIAFQHAGTIDKFTGDGVMIRFNVHRAVSKHQRSALEAATQMREAFQRTKRAWPLHEAMHGVHLRIGVATGPVVEAIVGHPQYRYPTVLGRTVNLAAALCDEAGRRSDVIAVDATIKSNAPEDICVLPLDLSQCPKTARYADAAFLITEPSPPSAFTRT